MKKIIQLSMVSFCLMLVLSCNKSNTSPKNNSKTSSIYSFEYTLDGVKYTWSGGVQTTVGNSSTSANDGVSASWIGIRDIQGGVNFYPQISAVFPAKVGTYIMDFNSASAPINQTTGLNVLISNTKQYSTASGGKVTFNVTACPRGLYTHVTGNFSGQIGELDLLSGDIVLHSISGKFDACNMTP
jgi:hypothetical protein